MSPVPIILTYGLASMLVLGVPLLLGLIWNKWAGGCAGFLMGSIYYVANAAMYSLDYNYYGQPQWNFFRDVSMIGYIVNAILIGYIAGALNHKSYKFKRMLGASLTASIATGVIQFILNYQLALEPSRSMAIADPVYSFFLNVGGMIPMLIIGFVIPVIAKFFMLFGVYPGGPGGHA
jgi:hypothetical protein